MANSNSGFFLLIVLCWVSRQSVSVDVTAACVSTGRHQLLCCVLRVENPATTGLWYVKTSQVKVKVNVNKKLKEKAEKEKEKRREKGL